MEEQKAFSWDNIKADLTDAAQYLRTFVRNPVLTIRDIPDWHWPTILLLQAIAGVITGILQGIFEQSPTQAIIGALLLPIVSTVGLTIFTGFFFYFFMFFKQRELPFKKLFTLMFLANLPYLVTYILTPIISPADLLGLAITCLLLTVGLVDYFRFEKRFIIKFLTVLYVVYLLLWVASQIQSTRRTQELHEKATPESMDILQKELLGD